MNLVNNSLWHAQVFSVYCILTNTSGNSFQQHKLPHISRSNSRQTPPQPLPLSNNTSLLELPDMDQKENTTTKVLLLEAWLVRQMHSNRHCLQNTQQWLVEQLLDWWSLHPNQAYVTILHIFLCSASFYIFNSFTIWCKSSTVPSVLITINYFNLFLTPFTTVST